MGNQKRRQPKLVLRKETVRILASGALGRVYGGTFDDFGGFGGDDWGWGGGDMAYNDWGDQNGGGDQYGFASTSSPLCSVPCATPGCDSWPPKCQQA